jgi:hypothetical protein
VIALPPLFTGGTHVAEIVDVETTAANDVGIPGRSGSVAVAKEVAVDEPILFNARIEKSYFPPLVRPVITIEVAAAVGVSGAAPAAVIE